MAEIAQESLVEGVEGNLPPTYWCHTGAGSLVRPMQNRVQIMCNVLEGIDKIERLYGIERPLTINVPPRHAKSMMRVYQGAVAQMVTGMAISQTQWHCMVVNGAMEGTTYAPPTVTWPVPTFRVTNIVVLSGGSLPMRVWREVREGLMREGRRSMPPRTPRAWSPFDSWIDRKALASDDQNELIA